MVVLLGDSGVTNMTIEINILRAIYRRFALHKTAFGNPSIGAFLLSPILIGS